MSRTVFGVSASILLWSLGDAANVTVPTWDYVPSFKEYCVEATVTERRWAFVGLPEGTPSHNSGKWPLYIHLVTDAFFPSDKTAKCPFALEGMKSFYAFSTPQESREYCLGNSTDGKSDTPWLSNEVQDASAPTWCQSSSHCGFDGLSGAMWDQRLKQYLVKNGVAVLVVNPYATDTWDSKPSLWDHRVGKYGGRDQVFLNKLFSEIQAGTYGPLDTMRTFFHGWSGSAQMVSWLAQLMATNASTFPNTKMLGGVLLSGGSYQCYNDGESSPEKPVGSCEGCSVKGGYRNSCNAKEPAGCDWCCPRNYTEAYYQENPSEYKNHPAMFLAQMSTEDYNADLCAARHYHDAMVANGGRSTLMLVPESEEDCFCIGSPKDPAAAGSPYSQLCEAHGWDNFSLPGMCCFPHTQGFPAMVEPAVQFVQDALADEENLNEN